MPGITGYLKLDFYTVCFWQQLLPICTVLRGGSTGYRKLDYYTVCCWQQLLPICTVARGGSTPPDDAAGRTNVHGVTGSRKPVFYTVHCDYMILPICTVLRGTVNWIITLCAVGSSYYQYAR